MTSRPNASSRDESTGNDEKFCDPIEEWIAGRIRQRTRSHVEIPIQGVVSTLRHPMRNSTRFAATVLVKSDLHSAFTCTSVGLRIESRASFGHPSLPAKREVTSVDTAVARCEDRFSAPGRSFWASFGGFGRRGCLGSPNAER